MNNSASAMVLFDLYLLGAILVTVVFLWVAEKSRDELTSYLGWFNNWSVVIMSCVIAGAIWPVVIGMIVVKVVKRIREKWDD